MSENKVGRPRKEDKYGGHIVAAQDLIADRLPQLIENLFRLADGMLMREVDEKDGTVDYYVTPPDRQANEYLLNRILGKPTERRELSGPDGGPIEVDAQAREVASHELDQWRKEMTEKLSSTPNAPPMLPISPISTG